MAIVLGLDAKLYVNTVESYAAPTWAEVTNCRDLTLTLEKGEADVTTRGNQGWRAMVGTLKEGTIEFEMVWDTADTNFDIFLDGFLNNTDVECAILDGDILSNGSQGLHSEFSVTGFTRNEALEEALTASVKLRPTYSLDNPTEWMVVGA